MTGGARDTSLKMRCMAKLDVGGWREAVDTHPRNFNILVGVLNYFLHLRLFFCQLVVTEHAFANRWNAGCIARIGADVAVNALHPQLHMSVVRKGDRLLGRAGRGAENNEPHAGCGVSNYAPDSASEQKPAYRNVSLDQAGFADGAGSSTISVL